MKKIVFFILCVLLLGSVGCSDKSKKPNEDMTEYQVYFLNKEETKIISKSYFIQKGDNISIVRQLFEILQTTPEDPDLKAPISGIFTLIKCYIDGEQLYLNFDEKYKNLSFTTEVLIRAAIVRTLCQIPDIKYVDFQVKGEPLYDSYGIPLGTMTVDQFIDNAGKEINTYEVVSLRLFFANSTGDGLVEVVREVGFNTNISKEKLVVEQLMIGPNNGNTFATIHPDTKLISITVKDGVCYVNFNNGLLTTVGNVTSEVTLYSIVNSLIDLNHINKVYISINGKSNMMFRETINLDTVFERNLEIIKTETE